MGFMNAFCDEIEKLSVSLKDAKKILRASKKRSVKQPKPSQLGIDPEVNYPSFSSFFGKRKIPELERQISWKRRELKNPHLSMDHRSEISRSLDENIRELQIIRYKTNKFISPSAGKETKRVRKNIEDLKYHMGADKFLGIKESPAKVRALKRYREQLKDAKALSPKERIMLEATRKGHELSELRHTKKMSKRIPLYTKKRHHGGPAVLEEHAKIVTMPEGYRGVGKYYRKHVRGSSVDPGTEASEIMKATRTKHHPEGYLRYGETPWRPSRHAQKRILENIEKNIQREK